MESRERVYHIPHLRTLSDVQIETLYQGALECLNRTGVEVRNAEARQLLVDAGASADGSRVRIPSHIIRSAVASTPRSFTVWGRDGTYPMEVGSDRVYFGPGPTCTNFVDPVTHQPRKTVRGDPGMAALVSDALPNIDYVMSLGLIDDVTPSLASVYEFAEMIAHTTKPVLPWGYAVEHAADIYEIAAAAAGGERALRERPSYAFFATCQAPLVHTDRELAMAFWTLEHGMPVVYLGGASGGCTAPVTATGILIISLALGLSGLAMLQLRTPGAAVCVGGVPHPMDLRTTRPAYGAPETSLYSAALSEVYRHLGVPFMGTAGATESKLLDLQAAIESTYQVAFSGLSLTDIVHDVGFLDCADIGSLEMLIMNDEIIAMTRRIMRGIDVSDTEATLDMIDRVGPTGNFLAEMETARQCRHEVWVPTLLDRDAWVVWENAGSKTMADRIHDRLREILATHTPPPLPAEVTAKIGEILRAAEAREGQGG